MTVGLLIECLVAVLLVTTIGYCIVLNRRLVRLRNDEQALKGTIAELVTATEIAERAISGLRITAFEADKTLSIRLREADALKAALDEEVQQGESVFHRIAQITACARSAGMNTCAAPAPAQRPREMTVVKSERVPFHRTRGVAA